MPIASNKLAHAVRMALALGVATLAPTAVVLAQDGGQNAAAQKPHQLKTITVTGSRIRSVDIENQQPIYTMTQKDIQKTGLATVSDILQHMVLTGLPGTNRSKPNELGAGAGGRYINMRSLGSNRVLVLVNGKRWVSNLYGQVDLSSIPSTVVQRIDVLKDGASSTYGSDAIVAVVNFILKDHFDGAQAHVYYGQNQKSDGITTQYDFTTGAHTDKSSLVFSAGYAKQGTVWGKTRPETAYILGKNHIGEAHSPIGPWGTFKNQKTK